MLIITNRSFTIDKTLDLCYHSVHGTRCVPCTLDCFTGVIFMARKFVLPDPADRSQNEPAVILSPTQVLGLFNQESSTEKKSRVVDSVKDAITKMARDAGWDEVETIGNQILLRKKFD